MRRSSLLGFVILNVVVTFVTVFVAIGFINRFSPPPTPRTSGGILPVIVTATVDPNKPPDVKYIVVTATPDGSTSGLPAPTVGGAVPAASTGVASNPTPVIPPVTLPVGIPTIDPSLLPPLASPQVTAQVTRTGTPPTGPLGTAIKAGCQIYAIKKGDTAGGIADRFGVSLADLMKANNLKDADLGRLQIDQQLVVPLGGCGIATDEPTPSITPTRLVLPTLPPTATIAPTASQAQLEVVQVLNPGDITSEGVEIRNTSGATLSMLNWTLVDANGLKFTFPDFRMFANARVTIYTRAGQNTPVVLYWGQSRAVWGEPGQVVKVLDPKGQVQASLTVGSSSGQPPTVPTPTQGS